MRRLERFAISIILAVMTGYACVKIFLAFQKAGNPIYLVIVGLVAVVGAVGVYIAAPRREGRAQEDQRKGLP